MGVRDPKDLACCTTKTKKNNERSKGGFYLFVLLLIVATFGKVAVFLTFIGHEVHFRYGLYHVIINDRSCGISPVCNREYIDKDLLSVGNCRLFSVSQK